MTTTTMESSTDLQNYLPQEQTQMSPLPGNFSSTTVPPTPRAPPASNTDDATSKARKKERNAKLCALSKTFGHIPNVPIFTQWRTRIDCLNSAVHRSVMAGICGNTKDGVYSVALSSSYKDDEDGGDVIIYTGAGGRERWSGADPKKRLRVGPQTKDQSWEHPKNQALIRSFLTGNPVRVIRSWRCSQYAPLRGYRYDGLYQVAAYWTAKGCNKKDICRCRLERLPDQPPIPLRPITISASRKYKKRLGPSPSTNPYDISADGTDDDMRSNQPNVFPTQLARNTGRGSEGLSNPPQRAMSRTSTGAGVVMGGLEPDVKHAQPLSPQQGVPPKPGALPRYRWDPKKHELIKIPTSHTILENVDVAMGDEDENRVEDDATLVPPEDVHERMETEYFSDICD